MNATTQNGAAITPGEMMERVLRQRCADCAIANLVNGGAKAEEYCVECSLADAVAAYESGEYTEVVTERWAQLYDKFIDGSGECPTDADPNDDWCEDTTCMDCWLLHLAAKDGGEDASKT